MLYINVCITLQCLHTYVKYANLLHLDTNVAVAEYKIFKEYYSDLAKMLFNTNLRNSTFNTGGSNCTNRASKT